VLDQLERIAVIAFYSAALFQGGRACRVVRLRGRKVSALVIVSVSTVWIVFYLLLVAFNVASANTVWPILSRFGHYFTAAMLFAQASMMLDVERGIAQAEQGFFDGQ
jgi:hypothetical protein